MNTVLYLVAQADKNISYNEFFGTLQIMNEQSLRDFLKEETELGHISFKNLNDHGITDIDEVYHADISEIFGILCNNDEYDKNYEYFISQQEVYVNEEDMYD